jgi:hypothetical protein
MKHFVCALAILLAGAVAYGQSCAETYNLQRADQVLRYGPLNNWQKTTKLLRNDLFDVEDISNDFPGIDTVMDYRFPISFTPNCANPTPAKITYRKKPFGQKTWSTGEENYPRIQLFDSTAPLNGYPNYWWWFGFYPNHRDTLVFFMGRGKTEPNFSNWFGLAYLIDSVRSPTTQLWSAQIRYIGVTVGPMDSARLDLALIGNNGWRALPWDANHHPHLFVHTVKLSYDSKPSAIGGSRKQGVAAFSARQQGRMVFIEAGAERAGRGEAVELWDMFGRKSAVLYPSGYLYAWNGKTRSGAQAPSGVYFARANGKVLGKFVYSH